MSAKLVIATARSLRDKRYREEHLEEIKAKQLVRYYANRDQILANLREAYKEKASTICQKERTRRQTQPERYLIGKAQKRALVLKVPFNLTVQDVTIPVVCPVLGIPLQTGSKGFHPNSPTIDRVIPELGYVKGNIAVISLRANKLKADATLTELKMLIDWLSNQCSTSTDSSSLKT